MIRICGRDISNVKHSDSLLAISWFVPGIWKCYNHFKSAWLQSSVAKYIRTALFWDIAQRVVAIPYRRFGTTFPSYFQGWRVLSLEEGADLLSRNVGKLLPIYCAYCTRIAQISLQTNNNFALKLWWHQQMHNCTFFIYFLLLNSYMFRHCRHLQRSYTKVSLKHTAINRNHFISIITKEFYKPIENIRGINAIWINNGCMWTCNNCNGQLYIFQWYQKTNFVIAVLTALLYIAYV
jgi:hypothetical protein